MVETEWRIRRGDFVAARKARHEFSAILRERVESQTDVEGAVLIFGELVTNAVRHANEEALVSLQIDVEARLRIADDGDSGFSGAIEPSEATSTSGRGLQIVAKLVPDLQFEKLSPGTAVTVLLPVRLHSGR